MALLACVAVLAMTGASAYDGPRGSRRDNRGGRCLLLDADLCPGNRTLTCTNSVEDVVCVSDPDNTGECPPADDLDDIERECGVQARHHACLLPEDAFECMGNRTLICVNSDGESVCVKAFNSTECPSAEDLDDVERVCRPPPSLDANRLERSTDGGRLERSDDDGRTTGPGEGGPKRSGPGGRRMMR